MAQTGETLKWWQRDATPGYLLLAAATLSFVLINSPASDAFAAFLKQPISWQFGPYQFDSYVQKMVKDALMAVFFLYVGLELKREAIEGPLQSIRTAALPAFAAAGGMAAPALIYVAIATMAMPGADPDYARGWAIPSATDIAFAIGVLALLGSRVPSGLRLFLLAVAIVDDLGAILIIALFYTAELDVAALAASGAVFAAMLAMLAFGVRALTPYWLLGVLLWAFMAETGMSPTLAGVLTAAAIPMRRPDGRSPLHAAEHALKPYVQLGIMPVFALAMAGAPLAGVTPENFLHPVALGIAAGLLLGKPIGIVGGALMAAMLLRQPLPGTLVQVLGISFVAGIGFTMSLFIGSLAFYDDAVLQLEVRLGVFGGSLAAAALGLLVLATATGKPTRGAKTELQREEDIAEERGVFEDYEKR